jgi:hypothetical protein
LMVRFRKPKMINLSFSECSMYTNSLRDSIVFKFAIKIDENLRILTIS